ncbi:MAG: radical SAM protein [Candidatus Omnitrophota bacterium]
MTKLAMRPLEKAGIAWKFAKALFFKKKYPLILVLHVTYRCNLRCKYCGFHERKTSELDTKKLINLIEEFYQLGTRFVVISGGEPLLRDDIGEIIDFCKKKRMFISMNSNGILVKEKIDAIRNIDILKLSLDGPREINDRIKGQGVYDKVLEAIEICKVKGVKVSITTVISRYNIFSLAHVLDIAKKYNIGVSFQPADQSHCGNIEKDISVELPEEKDFKKAVFFLIREKSKGNGRVNNSLAGLKHLVYWPGPRKIPCLVSRLSVFLSPEGGVFVCDMFPGAQNYLGPISKSLKETLNDLSLPYPCEYCWSGSTIDFNLLSGIRLNRIWGARKT